MQTFDSRLMTEIRSLAEVRVEDLKDTLAAGQLDIERYREHCGHIRGLREIGDLIDQAVAKVEGRERST